jgi:coenzyme F420-0:L-glutamate ligase/coenzyme F420-1:gamma-L-glutamate ligase
MPVALVRGAGHAVSASLDTPARALSRTGPGDMFRLGTDEALAEGHLAGFAAGRAEGLAEGHAEGRAEGRVEGLAEGRAEAAATIARLEAALLALRGDGGR